MILQFFSKEALRQHILTGQCSATNQCKKLAGVLSISSVLNTLLSLYHAHLQIQEVCFTKKIKILEVSHSLQTLNFPFGSCL